MKQLTIDTYSYQLPSLWNEMRTENLLQLAQLTFETTDINTIRLKLFLSCAGFKVLKKPEREIEGEKCFYLFYNKSQTHLVKSTDLACLIETMDFIFERVLSGEPGKQTETYYIKSALTRNPFPVLSTNDNIWYGPSDNLTNLTLSEFIHAETNFLFYKRTKKEQFLNNLIAILYRPEDAQYDPHSPSYTGDRREPFNDFTFEERAKQTSLLSPEQKEVIMFYYDGCRNTLSKLFPLVFTGTSSNAKVNPMESFLGLVNMIADHDVTKKDKVRQSLLFDVLDTLNHMIKKNNTET